MKVTYTYKIRNKETFTVIIEAFSKKSASIIVRCDSKAHISYSGQIIDLEKEDSKSK